VLLVNTHEQGYGNWAAIKYAMRRDLRCRFDHMLMSRTEQELAKRVDILVKSLEKEKTCPMPPPKIRQQKSIVTQNSTDFNKD